MSSASRPGSGRDAAPIFAALGDETRLALLSRLSDGRSGSIVALSVGLDLTRQAVTKHLQVLERAGLVNSARVGRESRFAYAPGPLVDARSFLDAVSARWDDRLARLSDLVER